MLLYPWPHLNVPLSIAWSWTITPSNWHYFHQLTLSWHPGWHWEGIQFMKLAAYWPGLDLDTRQCPDWRYIDSAIRTTGPVVTWSVWTTGLASIPSTGLLLQMLGFLCDSLATISHVQLRSIESSQQIQTLNSIYRFQAKFKWLELLRNNWAKPMQKCLLTNF